MSARSPFKNKNEFADPPKKYDDKKMKETLDKLYGERDYDYYQKRAGKTRIKYN